MKYDKIKGLDKKISKLIMGNDNQTDFDSAMSNLPLLLEDIPNYTNVEPQILIGEVTG